MRGPQNDTLTLNQWSQELRPASWQGLFHGHGLCLGNLWIGKGAPPPDVTACQIYSPASR